MSKSHILWVYCMSSVGYYPEQSSVYSILTHFPEGDLQCVLSLISSVPPHFNFKMFRSSHVFFFCWLNSRRFESDLHFVSLFFFLTVLIKETEEKWENQTLHSSKLATLLSVISKPEELQPAQWGWMKLIKLLNNIFCDHSSNPILPWQIMLVIVCPLRHNATMSSYPLSCIRNAEQNMNSQAVYSTTAGKLHLFMQSHHTE